MLVYYLLNSLSDRFLVFYDRESTFGALRLALPFDRTVDVGLKILFRNGALRAGGPFLTRSCSCLAPLKRLWGLLLHSHVPDNPVNSARGKLQLLKMFAPALSHPIPVGAANLSLAENWRSRFKTKICLADSLLLELESNASEDCRRRKADAALEIVKQPQRGSAPFLFVMRGASGIDNRRVEAINAQLKLMPHAGLALLKQLLKADLIAGYATKEFIQMQQRRIAASERSEKTWPLNVTVADADAHD